MKPDTIAKSLAIGNPADGFQVVKVVKETGGSGAMVTDAEILDAIDLLAVPKGFSRSRPAEPRWRPRARSCAAA